MRRMFVNGEFVAALAGETFAVGNPATEETIDEVPRPRAEEAEAAGGSAHAARDDRRVRAEKGEGLPPAAAGKKGKTPHKTPRTPPHARRRQAAHREHGR